MKAVLELKRRIEAWPLGLSDIKYSSSPSVVLSRCRAALHSVDSWTGVVAQLFEASRT